MKNRQTYLSVEDRQFLLAFVKTELDALLSKETKVTVDLIKKVNMLQSLVVKLEAKL